jgi:hypothetical protein
MRSIRNLSMTGTARWLACAALLTLAGCGSSQPALPSFPEYPPATAYLHEQDQLREQVQANEAYEARVRLINQIRASQRADAMWRRSEAMQAQREREMAFRESIRRMNEQRHFRDLQEFQDLR